MGDTPDRSRILTINSGSSSLKFALFEGGDLPTRVISGKIERIGLPDARFLISEAAGRPRQGWSVVAPDAGAAGDLLVEWIGREFRMAAVAAVGHRVVHGGGRHDRPERVTDALVEDLRRAIPMDPDHLPGEIALIETFRRVAPNVPQFACFDTTFHRDLPRVARIVPVPRRYEALGVRRYGFHGLSYEYLLAELARLAGPEAAAGRVILAHLGSGASLAAVEHGRCVETTMGFTPASGLVMGTRAGDIDPGLAGFLARAEGMTPDRFHVLVNRESGLLGVSETSSDLRDLLAIRGEDPRAAEAVELFCYRAKTAIGALAAALGGLDTLVFSGGIGENGPEARLRICEGLEFLGIALDASRNAANAAVISADEARTTVRVLRTDEESIIARAAAHFLATPLPETTA